MFFNRKDVYLDMLEEDIYTSMNKMERIQTLDRWEETRKSSDFWLDRAISGHVKNNKKALILGAGGCRDFSLDKLVDRFESVVLVDYDLNSMNDAIAELSDERKSKIEVKNGDFTGLLEGMADKLRDTYQNYGTEQLIKETEKFRDGLPLRFKEGIGLSLSDEYDFIFLDCVTTQLFAPIFWNAIPNSDIIPDKEIMKLGQVAGTTTNRLILPLLRTISRALNKDGVLAVAADVFVINGENRDFFIKKYGSLSSMAFGSTQDLRIVEDIKNLQVAGSFTPIEKAIKEKIKHLKSNQRVSSWLWDFSDNQQFIVWGSSYTKI